MSVIGAYVRFPVEKLDELRGNANWSADIDRRRIPEVDGMDVDKARDGIAWLLSRLPPSAPPVAGEGFVLRRSLAPLLSGQDGREEPLLDVGYGPAKFVSPAEVLQLSQWLSGVDEDALRSVYQPQMMADDDVYPQIWMIEQSALDDFLIPHFLRLRKFIAEAASANQALLVYFT